MDHLPLDPEPYLVGILLVTSSRAGPRLVLHYPPEPSTVIFTPKTDDPKTTESHDEESDSDDGAVSSDDDQPPHLPSVLGDSLHADDRSAASTDRDRESDLASPTSPPPSRLGPSMSGSALAQIAARSAQKRQVRDQARRPMAPDSFERLFGVSRDGLAKLMAPSGNRSFWNGRKLEIGARGRTFVGCPVFLRESDDPRKRTDKGESGTHEPAQRDDHGERGDVADGEGPISQTNAPTVEETPATLEPATTQASATSNGRPSMNKTTSTPYIPVRRPPFSRSGITDHPDLGAAGSLQSNASDDTQPINALTMFNLVLVLAPPPWEHQARVEMAFEHIVRPLSRAIRDVQREGWLDKEVRDAERLTTEWRHTHNGSKDGASSLYDADEFLQAGSHLYRTLVEVYRSISRSEIAFVDLKSTSSSPSEEALPTMSLQIPLPLNTPRAPAPGDPPMPALPVNTAALTVSGTRWRAKRAEQLEPLKSARGNAVVFLSDDQVENEVEYPGAAEEDDVDGPSILDRYDDERIDTTAAHTVSPHAAVLLTHDLSTLLSQLQGPANAKSPFGPLTPLRDPHPLSSALRYLLPAFSPRVTLHQLAPRLPGLTLTDISALTCLLIRLRVARPIPPLHASSVFIVDPNADLSRAHGRAGRDFSARFAALEMTLAETLSKLNGATAWAGLIPRKDLKGVFIDALAWLRREGFVTQLRTFAWIFVDEDVRRAVALRVQEAREADSRRENSPIPFHQNPPAHEDHSRDLLMAAVDARRHHAPRATSEAGSSTGSVRTTIPARATTPSRLHDDTRPGTSCSSTRSDSGPVHSGIDSPSTEELRAGLIQTPAQCTPFERQCIAHIGSQLPDDEGRRLWTRLVRYFDGETAVEEIAGMEGLKRKLVARVVGAWVDAGFVRVVRHW